jgi:Ca2+-binding RTX toxin-like protein
VIARLIPLALLTGATLAVPVTAAQAAPILCQGEPATIVGTPGMDILRGTPERDVIAGLGARDKLIGGEGDDLLCGGDGADFLFGQQGDDVLLAGTAHVIDGRSGRYFIPDLLDGGPGDDFLDIGKEPMDGGISGMSGSIWFDTASEPLVVDLTQGTAVGNGHDTIVPRAGLRIVGTVVDDVLIGSDFDEEFEGREGSDRIVGNGGDDHLYGDYPRSSSLYADDDTLDGGDGNDLLSGWVGADSLRGGRGDDSLQLTLSTPDASEDVDVVIGGPGRDDVMVNGPRNVEIRLRPGSMKVRKEIVGRIDHMERVSVTTLVRLTFFGTSGPDEVHAGSSGRLRARTFGGNDVIWGSRVGDVIDAGSGHDEVRGLGGNDICDRAEREIDCEKFV